MTDFTDQIAGDHGFTPSPREWRHPLTGRKADCVFLNVPFWSDPKIKYQHDYLGLQKDIAANKLSLKDVLRALVKTDPFFRAYFILGWHGANHPFIVSMCKDLALAPKDHRLLLAARGHGKSTIDTIGGVIGDICCEPEDTHGIFSFTRNQAQAFLRVIKRACETSEFLKFAFPEIFWEQPDRESSVWSETKGLLLKRESLVQEMTVEAWGLEKLPTGKHFNDLVFDDIVTIELVNTPELMMKTETLFDFALSLVSEKWRHRVTGTFYDTRDILTTLIKRSKYHVMRYPATADGTKHGPCVFFTREELMRRATTARVLNTQYLLDINPKEDKLLKSDNIRFINRRALPRNLYKILMIDPAGTQEQRKVNDSWAIATLGFDTRLSDEGDWDFYVLDLIIAQFGFTEAMQHIVHQVAKNRPRVIGVEKAALSTTEIHVANKLRAMGLNYTIKNKKIQTVLPQSRSKALRIEENLVPFVDNKRFILLDTIDERYVDILIDEFDGFPFAHVDGCDAISYGIDLAAKIRTMPKTKQPGSDENMDRWERLARDHIINEKKRESLSNDWRCQ